MWLLLSLVLCMSLHAEPNVVTYVFWNGRFGENILSVCFAKWLAHRYPLQFRYKPFHYSDELVLHDEPWFEEPEAAREPIVIFRDSIVMSALKDTGTLFIADYFTHIFPDWSYEKLLLKDDPVFKAELKRVIKPKKACALLRIPPGAVSVAVHVRRGGNFDGVSSQDETITNRCYEDYRFPLKFPGDDFYIEQIRYVAHHFKGQKLYVHIFTDDKNPQAIADMYAQMLNNPDITFGYRAEGNADDVCVVEDFFAMAQCECLIRPDSAFSKATQLIADYKLLIYPRTVKFIVCDVARELQ